MWGGVPQLVTANRTVIRGYDPQGFNVNGVRVRGSILAFPTMCLMWDVQGVEGVTAMSLSPAHLLKPRTSTCGDGDGCGRLHSLPRVVQDCALCVRVRVCLGRRRGRMWMWVWGVCSRDVVRRRLMADLVIVGTGDGIQHIDPAIYDYFRQRGVSIEVMSTVRFRGFARSASATAHRARILGACGCAGAV